jgi:hypothetical protein
LQGLRWYHSRRICSRELHMGDLVLRRKQNSSGRKLSPKWEGPYRVTRVFRPGSVSLEDKDGKPGQNSWNIEHLQKFYP